ncbi:MAG: hypothetical protein U0X39_14715 [Bacteroidales bacterium]
MNKFIRVLNEKESFLPHLLPDTISFAGVFEAQKVFKKLVSSKDMKAEKLAGRVFIH